MAKQKLVAETSQAMPKISAEPLAPILINEPATLSLEEQIRLRAYDLYEERGRQDGFEVEDWLRAETEILNKVGQFAA